jgi:hypothetical protein
MQAIKEYSQQNGFPFEGKEERMILFVRFP